MQRVPNIATYIYSYALKYHTVAAELEYKHKNHLMLHTIAKYSYS